MNMNIFALFPFYNIATAAAAPIRIAPLIMLPNPAVGAPAFELVVLTAPAPVVLVADFVAPIVVESNKVELYVVMTSVATPVELEACVIFAALVICEEEVIVALLELDVNVANTLDTIASSAETMLAKKALSGDGIAAIALSTTANCAESVGPDPRFASTLNAPPEAVARYCMTVDQAGWTVTEAR
jgi:hypothetical protein